MSTIRTPWPAARNHLPFEMMVLFFRTKGDSAQSRDLVQELGHVGAEVGVVAALAGWAQSVRAVRSLSST